MADARIKDLNREIYNFSSGDFIAVDGNLGAGKMQESTLLNITSQNALAKIVDTSEGANYTENSVYDAIYDNTVFHPTNGPSTNSDYISFGINIFQATSLYVKSCNSVYFSICVYPSNQTFNNGVRYRKTLSEDSLPYEASPLQLNIGDYVVISTRRQDNLRPFDVFFTNLLSIDNLSPKVPLTTAHIKQVKDSIKNRIYVEKRFYSAIKSFNVYIPAKVGYIKYQFVLAENLDTSSNFSVWRILFVDICTEDFTFIDHLTVAGEWECALKLKDADDFMGGATHGDEIMTDVAAFVDGQQIDFETFQSGWANEFRFVRKSTMYDPRDHVTATAEHGCEYVWNIDGLFINQSVKWLVAATVTNCFMGMNLPKKLYTTKGYIDISYNPSALPSYTRYQDAEKMVLFDESSGVFNLFENLGSTIANYIGNNSIYFTDNSGHDYNKGYFCITYTGQQVEIAANTLWKSKTHYVYDVAKDLSST